MKIVINTCFGGFNLSHEAMMAYGALKGIKLYPDKGQYGFTTYYTVPPKQRTPEVSGAAWHALSLDERRELNRKHSEQSLWDRDIPRDDPDLVRVVEDLGKKANGAHAELRVVEIPDDVEWELDEYDGNEHIAEVHRTWS